MEVAVPILFLEQTGFSLTTVRPIIGNTIVACIPATNKVRLPQAAGQLFWTLFTGNDLDDAGGETREIVALP